MTPSGFEPATFRFVVQHLNHCATAVPHHPRRLSFPKFIANQQRNEARLSSPSTGRLLPQKISLVLISDRD